MKKRSASFITIHPLILYSVGYTIELSNKFIAKGAKMEKIAAYFRTYLTYLNRNMFITFQI